MARAEIELMTSPTTDAKQVESRSVEMLGGEFPDCSLEKC
jgi:hypothetical protein